jgi:hypothetical protein
MDRNSEGRSNGSSTFVREQGRLLDIAARAEEQYEAGNVRQQAWFYQEGLDRIAELSAWLLNAWGDTHTSLFVGERNPYLDRTALHHRARPPTEASDLQAGSHTVRCVATVGRLKLIPELHRTSFQATLTDDTLGHIPAHVAGTPIELYKTSRPFEAIVVSDVTVWYSRLLAVPFCRDSLGVVSQAMVRDLHNRTLDSLLVLPLLSPWKTVALGPSRRLLGHILTTSTSPAAPRRSMLSELDSVLSAFAELVEIVTDTESGAASH